jgi:phage I-like protein
MNEAQKALAVKLGLGEDATVEQLNEKLQADALAEAPEPEAVVKPVVEPELEPVAAKTVAVSEEVWKQTNERLEVLEQRDNAREVAATTARRDRLVQTALSEGRIAPTEHDHYRSMLEVDEERTTKLLTALAAGRVPVAERGTAPSATSEAADNGWFPQFENTKETVHG